MLFGGSAMGAAPSTFTFTVTGPASTSVTVTPSASCPAFTCPNGPIAAGTTLATIAVLPAGWVGGIALSAPTGSAVAGTFAIGGSSPNYTINVGASALPIGFVGGATITSTP